MLRFLRIARLAVIDAVEMEFDPGLNVLTGETGAGKSILVEAVGLLLGGRASGELVRTGEDSAAIEAIFQKGDEEIVIRREITAQGRSRAFIDGTLVTAGALRDLSAGLIELHGQHEHQPLLDPATHLDVIDAFAQLEELRARTAVAHAAWRAAADAAAALRSAARDRATRLEFAAFQLQEIDRVAPRPGEDDELTATRTVLANTARIERLCNESYAALYDSDGAVLVELGRIWKRLGELAALDPAFEAFVASRDAVQVPLQDLAEFLRRYVDRLDASDGRLQQVEERLAALERLKRKHGPALGDVLVRRAALQQEVVDLEASDERLAAADRNLASLRTAYLAAAEELGARRRAVVGPFVTQLVELLGGLALERARFEVRFDPTPLPEAEWGERGIDRAAFHLSMNPGEDLRPLARIVSGGELSRVMLALKTMTFKARLLAAEPGSGVRQRGIGAPGMVFDEVDAGIGGRVAEVVGRRLRALGGAFQVLCITHLPQVAAHADTHFLIEKQVADGRTRTRVTRLTPERRVEEIGRMLAGTSVSPAVLASARELLTLASEQAKGESKSKGESERSTARSRKDGRGA